MSKTLFKVMWVMDVYADNHVDAALAAESLMDEPRDFRPTLIVRDCYNQQTKEIDLDKNLLAYQT